MGSRLAAIHGTDRLRLFALGVHVLTALPTAAVVVLAVLAPDPPHGVAFVLPLAVWLVGAAIHAFASALSAVADRSTRRKRIEGRIAAAVLVGAAATVGTFHLPLLGRIGGPLFVLTFVAMLALPAATWSVLRDALAAGAGDAGDGGAVAAE